MAEKLRTVAVSIGGFIVYLAVMATLAFLLGLIVSVVFSIYVAVICFILGRCI